MKKFKKLFFIVVAVSVALLIGVASTFNKKNLYVALYELRTKVFYPFGIDYGVRSNTSDRQRQASIPEGRLGVFMTFGQSNSANFGDLGYGVSEQVFNFYDGHSYKYEDPALGSNGSGGSVWGRVGDLLIQEDMLDSAVFGLAGLSSRSLNHLRTGLEYKRFRDRYIDMFETFGRVDAILFHQGEENHKKWSSEDYVAEFSAFLEQMKRDGIEAPIYVSRATYCIYGVDQNLRDIQTSLADKFENVYLGPDTDLLADDVYRKPDQCHFSSQGLDVFAKQWIEAFKASGSISKQ